MRRAAAFALGLLALGLAALWVGPRLLDWDSYRGELASIATAQLGRPVTLEGPITLSLLPQPRIESGRVTIGPEKDGLALDAKAIRLRLDLGALLRGRLEPREIAIVNADIRLPWPPGELPSFRPPSWLTVLDARLEDARLSLGGLEIEGLNASLVTGGVADSLVAGGRFAWRGQAVRFSAQLGRAGFDGIAPLDLTLATGGATLAAQGVLQPGGGFDGRMEAVGPDLGAFLPAPNQPFRAVGRLTAAADLLAANELAMDLGGQAVRGAVTLRLAPAPRLDLTLAAGRLDLEAWIGAARAALPRAGSGGLPVGVDLAAEATTLGGVPLRRLRGAFLLDGERILVSDVSALLPGETAIRAEGGTAASKRLELDIRFESEAFREVLAAFGAKLAETDPARLRRATGRFRVALQEGWSIAVSDLVATVDGARLRGDGVLRPAAGGAGRLSLGLGLTFDRLDLDGLLPPPWLWPGLGGVASVTAIDLNLRLAAESVAWGGFVARRAALDATLENGRLTLRRLGFAFAELDVALTGTASFPAQGGTPARFSDVTLEIGGMAASLAELLPAGSPLGAALPGDGLPVTLRLAGGGPAEAVALRLEGDLGELRVEAQGTIDAPARRGTGNLTLRHPGAPRLLAPLLGTQADAWLGQGSFALIAGFGASAEGIAAEHLDLVAGALRLRGRGLGLALAAEPSRPPRLTGRIQAERLPLPGAASLAAAWAEPLGLDQLGRLDAELALEAERLEIEGAPAAEQFAATLRLAAGTLRIEGAKARLGGGAVEGALVLEAGAGGAVPRLAIEAQGAEVALAAPLLGGLPFDLGAARLRSVALRLRAAGHSPAALAATLAGEVALEAAEGRLLGIDLDAIGAASRLPGLAEAEAALRRSLGEAGGETPFERLEIQARIEEGRAVLTRAVLAAATAGASAAGSFDLARGTLDLVLSARVVEGAPPVDLRLTGKLAAPRRVPEPAAFLRWKAEHG